MKLKLTIRIWILIAVLFLALIAIAPWNYFNQGIAIKSIEVNSTAYNEGLRQGMVIKEVNGIQIKSTDDYTREISKIFPSTSPTNSIAQLNNTIAKTNKTNNTAQLINSSLTNNTINNNTKNNLNNSSLTNNTVKNSTILSDNKNYTKLSILTNEKEFVLYTDKAPEITLSNLPKTKIKTGLDLSGGARALVKPEKPLSSSEMEDLIAVTRNRLNAFGISDVTVRQARDLEGNNFMVVEVAGATPTDLKDLVAKQGKFEAKIGNETVFVGGKEDITYVGRSGQEAYIESCDSYESGEICRFRFTVYLSEEAAKRHADITASLSVNSTQTGNYLDKTLDLYVDDVFLDSLLISEDLKGKVATQISIQGPGTGVARKEAIESAQNNMKKLQTILITGSLPYKLEIGKLDTISPSLGKEFARNISLLALIVFVIISIVLFIKYRKIKITLSVILTMFSEAFITLGIAAFISWNLDAPSIAGIIAGMGTGVNDQIVILDESVSNIGISLKERIKRALFIIVGAFFTIIAAMLPLFWAGAGLLRGFALTTIISVSVGILVTRPAFADIIRKISEKNP